MSAPDSSKQPIIGALLASGFPFQTAIAHLIKGVHAWNIDKQEFPWRDDLGVDRFLDLVISKHSFIVTIECKKTKKEVLIFLQPTIAGTTQKEVLRCRCFCRTQSLSPLMKWKLTTGELSIKPKSPESLFCVVSESGKDQRLLEKDAQLLVNGSDAYGCYLGKQPRSEVHRQKIIVPVIVTNAKLFIASYDPANVSLDTGELLPSAPATEISSIPWVRFTKSFSAAPDMGDSTVFVVSANSLRDFLESFEVIRDPL